MVLMVCIVYLCEEQPLSTKGNVNEQHLEKQFPWTYDHLCTLIKGMTTYVHYLKVLLIKLREEMKM
jgi:hypothetical protein